MDHNIKLHVPVSISYNALEAALKHKMIGEYIPPASDKKEAEPPYAQIQDISIAASRVPGFDVVLALKINVLRTLLKRNNVDLYVLASLGYDNDAQLLFLRKYKVDVRTQSGFFNASLEVLANNVAHAQIMKKAKFDLKQLIGRERNKVNALLESGLAVKGAVVSGAVADVRVLDIDVLPDKISLVFELQADAAVEIRDLLSLMPPQ